MRPIDADALIKALVRKEPFNDCARVVIAECMEEVRHAPTIKLEREIGTWIIDSAYPQHCWCSNCNHRFDLFDPKSIHFCPNCGSALFKGRGGLISCLKDGCGYQTKSRGRKKKE